MKELIGVYGRGGQGTETFGLLARQDGGKSDVVFIDDNPMGLTHKAAQVVSWEAFLEMPAASRTVTLAIGNGYDRQKIHTKVMIAGIGFTNVIGANVVTLDNVSIGVGALIAPFVCLMSNVKIGIQFQANTFSSVAHDCEIGDFVTFAPGVRCNGNVRIMDLAFIGSGAIIRQGAPGSPIVIGRGAIVGMGAVVTKSVPDGVTVVGNPARPLAKG